MSIQSPDHVPLSALLDVSRVENSTQAVDLLAQLLVDGPEETGSSSINLNVGNLVLTPKLVSKIRNVVAERGYKLEALFSTVPQTQQAALTEGLYVKSEPISANLLTLRKRPVDNNVEMSQSETDDSPVDHRAKAPDPQLLNPTDTQVLAEQQRLLKTPTLLLKRSLRSGKVMKHDGNLVIIGDLHAGSEVVATGDVVVWGEIRGIVHAGANGNPLAEIRAMRIEALQLRISDFIARRPDKVYYHKPNHSESTQGVFPEVARVVEGDIMIYKDKFDKNGI